MPSRNAFTIVEVTVASALMAFLALLLSTAWIDLGRPAAALIRRGQCNQEITVAVASLARDLGGAMAECSGGTKNQGQLYSWEPTANELKLNYDDNNHYIKYFLADNCLMREKDGSASQFVVAKHVESFTVVEDATSLTHPFVTINLTFKFPLNQPSSQEQFLERTCTLKVMQPPLVVN